MNEAINEIESNIKDLLIEHLSPEAVAVIANALLSHGRIKSDNAAEESAVNCEVQWVASMCVDALGGGAGYESACRELGI